MKRAECRLPELPQGLQGSLARLRQRQQPEHSTVDNERLRQQGQPDSHRSSKAYSPDATDSTGCNHKLLAKGKPKQRDPQELGFEFMILQPVFDQERGPQGFGQELVHPLLGWLSALSQQDNHKPTAANSTEPTMPNMQLDRIPGKRPTIHSSSPTDRILALAAAL